MKKRTLFTKLTLLCVGLLFFASCSDLLGFQEGTSSARNGGNGKVTFNGSICVTGALPSSLNEICHAELDSASQSSVSRSALPSYNIGNDYYYYVTATQTDGSETFNINSLSTPNPFTTTNGVTFALELATGSWNIECGIKKAETSGTASDDDLSVMSDTYPATVSTANPVVSHTFYPKPGQNGEGKVELKISVYTEISDFDRVTASCSKSAWAEKVSEPVYDTDSENWIIQTNPSNTLPSGTYEVTFNFYNTSNILLYSTVQTINVFDNMTTNTWLSDGSGVIAGDGTFAISSSLVTSFARTTFYVGQTAAATKLKITASDITGNGSPYAPFETVTKAVEVIAATGNSSKDYRIFVSGTVTGAQEISDAVNGKANSITMAGLNGLDSSTQEPKDILDGNSSGSTLTVESNVSVTITNLKITKGNGTGNSSKYGGGIYISDRASLALGNGALVTQNTASYGGGIYNRGKLFLYGTAMVGMQTNSVATSDNCGNKATEGGAGIYVNAEGQIYLGYRNESKPEELTGGVCGNYNAGIIDEYNQDYLGGGGIHLEGSTDTAKIEIASGNISYNYAVNGAGIFATGNVTMTGGTIKGNEGNSDDTENGKGGGLYLSTYSIGSYRTFTMSGSAVIENNKNIAFGAGVYLRNSNCTFEMKGGEIIDNIALSNGGAVYLNDDSSFNIQGEANIPYGGEANKNDIYMRHTTIRITDPLSDDRDAGKVIGLTPSSWTRGTTVVKADGTNVKDLTPYKDCFAFTQDGWKCKVSSNNQYLVLDAPIYVAGADITVSVCGEAGNDTSGKGTKAKPYATIAKACGELTNSSTDYTIYIDGTLTGVQSISDSSIRANSLTIQGTSSSATINGNNAGPALQLGAAIPNLSILRLTITGGKTSYRGGGIHTDNNSGSDKRIITLGDGTEDNGVTITGNTAEFGGGIYIDTCYELAITNGCEISDNQATHDYSDAAGGGVYNAGSLIMTGGKINNNQAMRNSSAGDGGGIYNDYGTVYLSGGEINSNVAAVNGGGIYRYHGNIFVYDSAVIESNDAACGGGIFTTGTYAIAEDGTKKVGTGFLYIGYSSEGTISATTCTVSISKNNARGSGNGGGGIHIASGTTVKMAGGTISENTADNGKGGGIQNLGTLTISGGTIANNRATYKGGAIFCDNNSTSLEIRDNADIPQNTARTNDIHLDGENYITVSGELKKSGDGEIAISHDSPAEGLKVLDGSALTSGYKKFSDSSGEFYVGTDGTLKAYDLKSIATLDDLTTTISSLNAGTGVKVNITADISSSSSSQYNPVLTIPENTTVILTSSSSKKITCTSTSSSDARMIELKSGAKLILSGITLERGADTTNFLRALHIGTGAEVIMKDGTTINGFEGWGSGTVWVGSNAVFTMEGGTFSNCNAGLYGSVVSLWDGIFNFYGGTITNCSKNYPIYFDHGSGTMNWKVNNTTYDAELESKMYGSGTVNKY